MNALTITALIYLTCLAFVIVLFERARRQGPSPEFADPYREVVAAAERITRIEARR